MAKQPTVKKFDLKPEGKRIEEYKGLIPPARLASFYREQVVPALMKKFGYTSIMQVPKLTKICLNMGVGAATQDQKILQNAVNEMELITGQRPAITRSKKAIANFKLRAGQPLDAMLHYAELECSNFWIVLSILLHLVFAILEVFPTNRLMVVVH